LRRSLAENEPRSGARNKPIATWRRDRRVSELIRRVGASPRAPSLPVDRERVELVVRREPGNAEWA
jgi:hypothetical protein